MAAHVGGDVQPREVKAVLSSSLGGGPMGLGDPNDKTLRKVELEVVIPKKMKEKAKKLCSTEVAAFSECGKTNGLLLPFLCRKENAAMNKCIIAWYQNEQFKDEMTQEYLAERTAYRATGIARTRRRYES